MRDRRGKGRQKIELWAVTNPTKALRIRVKKDDPRKSLDWKEKSDIIARSSNSTSD